MRPTDPFLPPRTQPQPIDPDERAAADQLRLVVAIVLMFAVACLLAVLTLWRTAAYLDSHPLPSDGDSITQDYLPRSTRP